MTDTDTVAEPRAPERHIPWLTILRAVLVVVCTVAAFWNLLHELIEDVQQGSGIGYIFLMPVLGGFAAIGIALRRRNELPIHDRQADIIVGLLLLSSSVAILGLLVQRYRYEYEVFHLDLVAVPLFLMSLCVLLFGLRPVFRFWPAWLLVLIGSIPLLNLEVVITLGGDRIASGAGLVLFTAGAAAIAGGRTWRRGLVAALLALAVGGVVLLVIRTWFRDAPLFAYQMVPACSAITGSALIMYLYQRDWSTLKPLDRPVNPATAARSRSAVATVLAATAAVMLIDLPHEYITPVADVPGLIVAESPAVAPGWRMLNERAYPWAPRYFGHNTSWVRQQWQAQRGNPAWDKESRRRRIMVDIVRSEDAETIGRYPEFVMYRLAQPRISAPVRIDLGHGVSARLNTVLDDRQLLSWTWLSWTWRGSRGIERISLIAADNHLPDAKFPQPEPSVIGTFENLLHQTLRGSAVDLDPEGDTGDPGTQHKDQDMLTAVAREIVRIGAGG
ncbi:hypothetical protein [Nocardia huaxiensis]|uniref:Exosortase/archaeosortase family protein n=1 Tax=Nocardia huaxiensis TaxID=2755382 RepID=A0A7D6ZTS1_9NOCA|nr:hypothetical protein [Nocardia huaxiensis]QLY33665.1 hypothetical protein H0264_16785 [Nocardia huaxiensis]UFS99420.1 exosortase/archaeosortase family protein [Nocardia huaxiensis]